MKNNCIEFRRKRKSVKLVVILSMDFTTPTAIIRLFVSWIIRWILKRFECIHAHIIPLINHNICRKNLVNARDVMDILREIF